MDIPNDINEVFHDILDIEHQLLQAFDYLGQIEIKGEMDTVEYMKGLFNVQDLIIKESEEFNASKYDLKTISILEGLFNNSYFIYNYINSYDAFSICGRASRILSLMHTAKQIKMESLNLMHKEIEKNSGYITDIAVGEANFLTYTSVQHFRVDYNIQKNCQLDKVINLQKHIDQEKDFDIKRKLIEEKNRILYESFIIQDDLIKANFNPRELPIIGSETLLQEASKLGFANKYYMDEYIAYMELELEVSLQVLEEVVKVGGAELIALKSDIEVLLEYLRYETLLNINDNYLNGDFSKEFKTSLDEVLQGTINRREEMIPEKTLIPIVEKTYRR